MSVLNYFKKEDQDPKKSDVKTQSSEPKFENKNIEKPVEKGISINPHLKSSSIRKNELASLVLENPHISEKGTFLNEQNQYVFRVASRTNRSEVRKAIEALYKVKVESVNIINQPVYPKSWRGKPGYRSGYKKAIITLKAGDKIEIAV